LEEKSVTWHRKSLGLRLLHHCRGGSETETWEKGRNSGTKLQRCFVAQVLFRLIFMGLVVSANMGYGLCLLRFENCSSKATLLTFIFFSHTLEKYQNSPTTVNCY